jgi:hypothetical protein
MVLLALRGAAFLPVKELVFDSMINVSFVGIQLVLLTLYICIKNKRIVNPINSYLGSGDILLFLALTLGFSPLNFLTFYISSILLSLVFFLVWKIITKSKEQEVPLAGILSISLIIVQFVFSSEQLHNDSSLISFLNG